MVLTALIVGGISIPATAEPPPGAGITAVPDGGARPATFGETLVLPSGSLGLPPTLPTSPLEVLGAQRNAARVEAEVLADKINELEGEHERARLETAWAQYAWSLADEKLKAAKQAAAAAANDAYMSARELPPQFQNGSLVRDLDLLQPRAKTFSESTAYELQRAVTAEKAAAERLEKATADEKLAKDNLDVAVTDYNQRDAARAVLEQRYAELEADSLREADRLANKLSDNYNPGEGRNGWKAGKRAQEAVNYALKQLGKPYRYSEEGPTYFDCSGLVWAAYRPEVKLPRVSWQMFQATRQDQVQYKDLLPGDLVFYARPNDNPAKIYHVAMYLGDDKVVHATSDGDVVKISKLNFGPGGPVDFMTRVVKAVPDNTAQ